MMRKIGCVISYCSNDYRFLSSCIEGLKPIAREIVVSVCDHFFDGTPEDRGLLDLSYSQHPDIKFIEYPLSDSYGLYGGAKVGREALARYRANAGRYVGLLSLSEDIEYVLFADVDELAEKERLKEWLAQEKLSDAMLFSSYLYLGHEGRRSSTLGYSYLLVKKEMLSPEMLFHSFERPGFFNSFTGAKKTVLGLDGKPMIHHYNWVRSDAELKKKVVTWGHQEEQDWLTLIEEEQLEKGSGLTYTNVFPVHSLLSTEVESLRGRDSFEEKKFTNVVLVTPESVAKRWIEREFFGK